MFSQSSLKYSINVLLFDYLKMNHASETIIKCPNCGQLNRIPNSYSQNKRPICSKCWSSLISNNETENIQPLEPDVSLKKQIEKFISGYNLLNAKTFFVIIFFCVMGWLLFYDSSEPNKNSYSTNKNISRSYPIKENNNVNASERSYSTNKNVPELLPSYPEQILPQNGAVQIFSTEERIAPLKVNTGSGSNYLLKLVDANTKESIMTIFIHGGLMTEVDVPLGNYELRYASGEKWYGYKHLFGPNTSYSKADKTFNFIKTESKVSGYSITLYKVLHGNLRTSTIEPYEF